MTLLNSEEGEGDPKCRFLKERKWLSNKLFYSEFAFSFHYPCATSQKKTQFKI